MGILDSFKVEKTKWRKTRKKNFYRKGTAEPLVASKKEGRIGA
jgi:hypothetical protein